MLVGDKDYQLVKGIYSRVKKVTNPLRIKSTLCLKVDKLKLIKENFSSGLG